MKRDIPMPTETRSSNTEMVSVPEGFMLVERSIWTEQQVEAATACITRLRGVHGMRDRDLAMAAIDAAQCKAPDIDLADLLPVQQPHPDPIAWMVGTAIWRTKEEAERDAAATGLPIVGLGPMTCAAPAEQHQGEPVAPYGWHVEWADSGDHYLFTKVEKRIETLRLDSDVKVVQLYTHADPGEVERLRTMFDQTDADLRSVTSDRDTLRAEADRLRQEVASIDKKLRGNVSDPDPLKPIMPGALSITTTYGLVAGIVRERDQLKKALERQP